MATKRKDGLQPGEVARAKRVAYAVACAVGDRRRAIVVRSVIAQLKQNKLRPRDFDQPNGEAAIQAIVMTMTSAQLYATTPPMGKVWELIASRAIQYLGKDAYR